MNTFLNGLKEMSNYDLTDNGALAHKSTNSAVYDLFALGGAYRNRTDEDCIFLFKKALEEDETLALKALFYLRDCRGGQGERYFFRVCFRWLAHEHRDIASRLLKYLPEYGRYDDLVYTSLETKVEKEALDLISSQLTLDMQCKTPSLLAKWMPSENASSKGTKRAAAHIRKALGLTHKEYRKMLSELRKRINVLERLMSANRWEEIEFDKIPSKAGMVYKNAFARRDIIAKKYKEFVNSKTTTVNADTLYPYEIVRDALKINGWYGLKEVSDTERKILEKYWENQIDYFEGKESKMICVCDTSGSMGWRCSGNTNARPIEVAISLSMYCAERLNGPFKDHYISFSSEPQLIKIEGLDFVDKVRRIYKTNLYENTNLTKVFNLLLNQAKKSKEEDIPETIVIISDMQIDEGLASGGYRYNEDSPLTKMEQIKKDWKNSGLKCPKLVYWNVNAVKDTILDLSPNVSYVSGASPVVFKQVITGKTGQDLMLEVLNSERYAPIE